MAKHGKRSLWESWDDAPSGYLHEAPLARRRRLATEAKDAKKAAVWDRTGSDKSLIKSSCLVGSVRFRLHQSIL